MKMAETEPSSSGLPPPQIEKSENKGPDKIKKKIDQLKRSIQYLQHEINNLKKEKTDQDELIQKVLKQGELNEKRINSYKNFMPPEKKERLENVPPTLKTPISEKLEDNSSASDSDWNDMPGDHSQAEE